MSVTLPEEHRDGDAHVSSKCPHVNVPELLVHDHVASSAPSTSVGASAHDTDAAKADTDSHTPLLHVLPSLVLVIVSCHLTCLRHVTIKFRPLHSENESIFAFCNHAELIVSEKATASTTAVIHEPTLALRQPLNSSLGSAQKPKLS